MSYSTLVDVRRALTPGGAADDLTTAAGMTDADLQDQIDEADSTIDSFLSMRYVTPVVVDPSSSTAKTLRFWSRTIAAYLATLTRAKSKDLQDVDPVVRRYRNTMNQLTLFSQGRGQLTEAPELPASETQNGVTVQNQYAGDLFMPGDFSLFPRPIGTYAEGRWPDIRPSGGGF